MYKIVRSGTNFQAVRNMYNLLIKDQRSDMWIKKNDKIQRQKQETTGEE